MSPVRFNLTSPTISSSNRSWKRSRIATRSKRSAEKFHSSPALLNRLNPGQTFAIAGEQIIVPNVTPFDVASTTKPTPPAGVRIVVSKRAGALTVEDEKGQVLFFAPVTTGSEHDPLPIGKWKVTGVQLSPAFHYNPDLFWDADPTHSKAKIRFRSQQPRRRGMDRHQQAALGHSRHARAIDDRTHAITWMRADDELGRSSSARVGEGRNAGGLRMRRFERGRVKYLQRLAITIAASFTIGMMTGGTLTWRVLRGETPTAAAAVGGSCTRPRPVRATRRGAAGRTRRSRTCCAHRIGRERDGDRDAARPPS